jgi:trehalose utilization protein
MSKNPLNIVVWDEACWDKKPADQRAIARKNYPNGIHTVIEDGLREHFGPDAEISTAKLSDPEHGLSEERLNAIDVLLWWGHLHHADVADSVAERVARRVRGGMGFVPLHSAHKCKPFIRLMGTSGLLSSHKLGQREILWWIDPTHPLCAGFRDPYLIFEEEEMYGEPFDIAVPDELVGISNFACGDVFRSVCSWKRGLGRIVYLRPGDELYPTYHDDRMKLLIANAVRYVSPGAIHPVCFGRREPVLLSPCGSPVP